MACLPASGVAMLLVIDNYDSFTFNIVQYFLELGARVRVVRNDELTLGQIEALAPEQIVISPGPRTPMEAGVSVPVVRAYAGRIPILGVCLGHQSIGQAFGGEVIKAVRVMHGKTSRIFHCGRGIFADIKNPFIATRYHSLVLDRRILPADLEVTAWTEDGSGEVDEIMGVRHRHYRVEGVQFHPESILSESGHQLFGNFFHLTR